VKISVNKGVTGMNLEKREVRSHKKCAKVRFACAEQL